jgi:hypothetical protein
MLSTFTALAAFSSLVSAHFNLNYPAARGFDEDKLTTFPCGGQDTVSTTRTAWRKYLLLLISLWSPLFQLLPQI